MDVRRQIIIGAIFHALCTLASTPWHQTDWSNRTEIISRSHRYYFFSVEFILPHCVCVCICLGLFFSSLFKAVSRSEQLSEYTQPICISKRCQLNDYEIFDTNSKRCTQCYILDIIYLYFLLVRGCDCCSFCRGKIIWIDWYLTAHETYIMRCDVAYETD